MWGCSILMAFQKLWKIHLLLFSEGVVLTQGGGYQECCAFESSGLPLCELCSIATCSSITGEPVSTPTVGNLVWAFKEVCTLRTSDFARAGTAPVYPAVAYPCLESPFGLFLCGLRLAEKEQESTVQPTVSRGNVKVTLPP